MALAPRAAFAQLPLTTHPLSDAQLQKLLSAMAAAGRVRQIGLQITALLGAGGEDEVLTCVQIKYEDGKRTHTFAKQKGYRVGLRDDAGVLHIYFANLGFDLSGAIDETDDQDLEPVPLEAARPGLEAELKFWAKAADNDFK